MHAVKDKVVIVTGASEGIGRALAMQLSAAGARLMLAARNQQRLQALAEQLPGEAEVCPCDVAQPQQCQQLVAQTLVHFGRLDILVNNAGITMWSRFDDSDDLEVFERLMRVNYLGAVYLTHAALPALKQSRGSVVAVASLAGLTGVPCRSGYAASKHAMVGFFDSLRIELKDQGVDVTVICPDFVVSQIHKRAIGADGQPLGQSPMQESKIMTAEQCAQLCLTAIGNRDRLLITSLRGKLGRWLRLLAPGLIDRIADRAIRQRH
ncbi:SDR family oxidoreductase [Ferrimonas sp. SCSIO 43195]|uniref:SDR family oxidoreductase n=1 Tax=Ferrimonas sp. SCSIO 43195 TaxID=2822844 RepID=UPI00207610B5|nr:SDR family oxidoreductase [Ferrimonas sp. SCSIO 43195]USD37174.1 SDR family oxidoreductase [Ferrimonas sp. SCSIO 43195]